jgi:hypothetical protein
VRGSSSSSTTRVAGKPYKQPAKKSLGVRMSTGAGPSGAGVSGRVPAAEMSLGESSDSGDDSAFEVTASAAEEAEISEDDEDSSPSPVKPVRNRSGVKQVWMDGWMYGCMDACTYGWVDG